MKGNSRQLGNQAEQQALAYLERQGLSLINQNVHSRRGEIDLIMRHGTTLVFIEVRQRSRNHHGNALESVSWHKQQRIIQTAQHYLQSNPKLGKHPCRFDVVAIDTINEQQKIQWIQDAFQA